MTSFDDGYRGRFAPSPTGPLHLGSLLTAVASFLDARAMGGEWMVRIEDIDPPREIAGASQMILESLQSHGLQWDGDVVFQSARHDAYRLAMAELSTQNLVFDCNCTRATLGPGGSCGRRCAPQPGDRCAKRLSIAHAPRDFLDRFQGDVPDEDRSQDIVIWRKDNLPSYQLAVTVDDTWQGITAVVRGADLLSQTALQVYLMGLFGGEVPSYAHVPVLCTDDGRKLSKQNGAAAIDDSSALHNLRLVLRLLQQPSADLPASTPQKLLQAAVEHWEPHTVHALGRRLVIPSECYADPKASGTTPT